MNGNNATTHGKTVHLLSSTFTIGKMQ